VPYQPITSPGRVSEGRTIQVEGPKFVLERWSGREHAVTLPEGKTGWLIPVTGSGSVAGVDFKAGECVTVTGSEQVVLGDDADVLFAYSGTTRI
jgi:mannose-6-phosphate isomerase